MHYTLYSQLENPWLRVLLIFDIIVWKWATVALLVVGIRLVGIQGSKPAKGQRRMRHCCCIVGRIWDLGSRAGVCKVRSRQGGLMAGTQ